MHETARLTFTRSAAALRAAISPHDIWDLRHLVQPVDHEEPASVRISPADSSWIAPTVITGLHEDPSFADHVAALIMDPSTSLDHEGAAPVQVTRYSLAEPRTVGISEIKSLNYCQPCALRV
jgi:hypothetical protein